MNHALLKELAEARGVPGQEGAVRAIAQREMAPLVDEISIDAMGNLIGIKNPGGSPRVMLAAHMDEIGFIVKYIEDGGFLRLQPLGGFDPRQLFAQRMRVDTIDGEVIRGILTYATKPTHLLKPGEAGGTPVIDQFFLDVGMTGDEARERIRLGAMAAMDRTCERIGTRIVGKSLDNRVSVFIMLEALRQMGESSAEIIAVATTQEEIGCRGAHTAATHLKPDIGVALDVTLALDHPGPGAADVVTSLGQGTGIKIMDSSLLCHPLLVEHFREIAIENNIPHQMEILPRGGTDGSALQRANGGIPAITLSTPCRYIHTVNEMVDETDVQASIDLLAAYLCAAKNERYEYSS